MSTVLIAPEVAAESNLREILEGIQSEFKIYASSPFNGSALNFQRAKNSPVHGWIKYREGFDSEIVNYFIDRFSPKKILDPFCGSGTTLVKSSARGIPSHGIDINPIATLLARVKTTSLDANRKKMILQCATKAVNAAARSRKMPKPPSLYFKPIQNAFDPLVLVTLLRLRDALYEISEGMPEPISNFLFCAWISIIEPVSYTFKEGNGIKYNLGRPLPAGVKKNGGGLGEYFLQKVARMLDEVPVTSAQAQPVVLEGSCIEMIPALKEKFDLALFSPPYANRFDYFEIFKLELALAGFVTSYEQVQVRRSSAIRSNLMVPTLDVTIPGFKELDEVIELMRPQTSTDRKTIVMLKNYFHDIRNLFTALKSRLCEQGHMVVVIGNSAYMNTLVPSDLLMAVIARQLGFRNIGIYPVRTLTTSSQQRLALNHVREFLRESVIVAQK